MQIQVDLVPPEDRKTKPDDVLNVAFGTVFSDHMFSAEYDAGVWTNARIHKYQPLQLDPAALCLHYGQAIFEGMKAYRRDNRVFLFRPLDNMRRMNQSASRMVMPQIDVQFALDSLKQLIDIERDWVPRLKGSSLYIRPTMIATEPKLGVKPSDRFLYYVILQPAPATQPGCPPSGSCLSSDVWSGS